MKRTMLFFLLSTTYGIYCSEIDRDSILERQEPAVSSSQSNEAIIEGMQNILIASGVSPQTLQVEGDTLAHRAVRMGKVAVSKVLGLFGIEYTKKNAQGLTPLELARSIHNTEAANLLKVDLLAEFEAGDFGEFESKLIEYIQECLVPEGDLEEAFTKLHDLIANNNNVIQSLDTYYPDFLRGESLGHALDQYNPQLYLNRDRIIAILEPQREKKAYLSSRSHDEEVADLMREYLNDDTTTWAELRQVYAAWPIVVDYYKGYGNNKTLGAAIDASHDEQLQALCCEKRRDTSGWITAETDLDKSHCIDLLIRSLIGNDSDALRRLDFYLRFSQTNESLCSQYLMPFKNGDQEITIAQFLKNLSPELFPTRDDLEKRLSIVYFIERPYVSEQACLEQLTQYAREYPRLNRLLAYAHTQYTGPVLTVNGTTLSQEITGYTLFQSPATAATKRLGSPTKRLQKTEAQELMLNQRRGSHLSNHYGKVILAGGIGLALYWFIVPSKKSRFEAQSEIL